MARHWQNKPPHDSVCPIIYSSPAANASFARDQTDEGDEIDDGRKSSYILVDLDGD